MTPKTCGTCMLNHLCVIYNNTTEALSCLSVLPIEDEDEAGLEAFEKRVQEFLADECPYYILDEEEQNG